MTSEQPPLDPPPLGPPPLGPPPAGPPPLGPPPEGPPAGWSPAPGPEHPEEPGVRTTSARTVAVVVAVVVAVLGVALAVLVPLALDAARERERAAVDRTLDEVRVYDDLPTTHESGDVDYPQSPPVGGPHDPAWLDCGVYDEPVPEENLVHDLEHGTVFLAHDPDLDADQVAALAGLLPQNGIMAPYDDLGAPVVVTVWGRQLALTGADDPRLPLFLETFGAGQTAPEPMASCAGGLRPEDVDDGGVAA